MNGFEKRTLEKRQQIINATFTLINQKQGIQSLKIEDIAREANVGKTTIFKYFGNKETLIHETFAVFIDQIRQQAHTEMEKNLPFEETLIALSQNKMRAINQMSKQFYLDMMVYMTEKNENGLSILMEKYTKESIDMLLDLFHRGRKEGKVDLKYSDEFLILYFQSLVEGMSHPTIYERMLPYSEEWTEILLAGMAPKSNTH
jgi:AcrR family transcriptional regulator